MFRFTIRDVLWLMVVVGMIVGWCIERTRNDEDWDRAYLEGSSDSTEFWRREFKSYDSRIEHEVGELRKQLRKQSAEN